MEPLKLCWLHAEAWQHTEGPTALQIAWASCLLARWVSVLPSLHCIQTHVLPANEKGTASATGMGERRTSYLPLRAIIWTWRILSASIACQAREGRPEGPA